MVLVDNLNNDNLAKLMIDEHHKNVDLFFPSAHNYGLCARVADVCMDNRPHHVGEQLWA